MQLVTPKHWRRRRRKLPDKQPVEKIKALAEAIMAGRVWNFYSMMQIDPQIAKLMFMPITLGGLTHFTMRYLKSVQIIANEEWNRPFPRFINGYPMFGSCEMWRNEDYQQALDIVNKMRAVLEGA